jgi:hypothetical protein
MRVLCLLRDSTCDWWPASAAVDSCGQEQEVATAVTKQVQELATAVFKSKSWQLLFSSYQERAARARALGHTEARADRLSGTEC